GGIHPEGLLFIDSDLVQLDIMHSHIYKLNASVLSYERFGSKLFGNMIMLGYLTAIVELISKEAMEESISQKTPGGTEEENLEAFEIGYNIGLKEKSGFLKV
ncbi:MAG TPA: 2-oxoacid:ferredoxin oxidoreductase subunit gamma, partial [Thermoplasmatales archaeon]|nr:2-oxoacid:ferredoxin oxidoreductase subunit gamma [Thermoplasmatales archaeon]